MLITELLDKYETEVVPKHSPNTRKDYAWHLRRLRKTFGHIGVKELKPQQVGQFLDTPTGKISRNRSIAVLSAAFTKAVGRWWLADVNPCLKVERNESHARTRYITDDEYNALRDTMPARMQVAMDLALLTSQRQGDLLNLTWQQVLPDGIFFRQGKTGKRLVVDMSPALEAVLLRAMNLGKGLNYLHVIRTTEGAPYTSEGFRANWQRYMRLALQRALFKIRYTFHDIRAKCVSDTKDLQEASNRAGHQNMGITRAVYDRAPRRVSALR
jgi:integrase